MATICRSPDRQGIFTNFSDSLCPGTNRHSAFSSISKMTFSANSCRRSVDSGYVFARPWRQPSRVRRPNMKRNNLFEVTKPPLKTFTLTPSPSALRAATARRNNLEPLSCHDRIVTDAERGNERENPKYYWLLPIPTSKINISFPSTCRF